MLTYHRVLRQSSESHFYMDEGGGFVVSGAAKATRELTLLTFGLTKHTRWSELVISLTSL